jgi:glycosyltransferase involved in cell wall biosynthesis
VSPATETTPLGGQTVPREGAGAGLQARLDAPPPPELAVGAGTALFLSGYCFHPRQRIRDLLVGPAGKEAPTVAHGMPRPDVARSLGPQHGAELSYRSGFWTIAELEPVDRSATVELQAIATLEDGQRVTATLGPVTLAPRPREAPVDAPTAAASSEPLVAVCMATYDPPVDLLERQLESIRCQTHRNWICVVSDDRSSPARFAEIERLLAGDRRFVLSRSTTRRGPYQNFERALSMTPSEAVFVTLADQDDRWYPEKLETLVDSIGTATLVYSDARIVDRQGNEISGTYWSRRRNNYTNLASLLIANTVTGAASLFRRQLLDLALPFPPRHGLPYHDHWLALVALASDRIAYVDRPLYEYVQHSDAALGHARANAPGLESRTALRRLRKVLRDPRSTFGAWRTIYFWDVCRLLQFATVLERRCGERMSARKRRALRLMIASERSPRGIAWLWLRGARKLWGRNETLGSEGALLRGIAWRHGVGLIAGGRTRPRSLSRGNASPPPPPQSGPALPIAHPAARMLTDKLRPLELDLREDAPERVNLLLPTIDLRHFFGGYIGKLNLARRLAEQGWRVRLVTVDETPPLPRSWQRTIESYSGLDRLFDEVEVGFAREGGALEVSAKDRFVATTWWTAHLAHGALRELERERFLYLIQEYEPFTFAAGSLAAIASQSYELPHFALFSTELLRDYFRLHGLGVFSAAAAGDRASASFENAITQVDALSATELSNRRSRRFLFYARPEPHAARNMFELGLLAIANAVDRGDIGPEWELHGIGAVEHGEEIQLGHGAALTVLPRRSQRDYAELLSAHDAGLALMYTAHPSLVPIEMAAAGMLTVTNTFENKTKEALAGISSNLIAVDASLEGLTAGLREAVGGVDDVKRRIRGSEVNWKSDWNDSLDDDLMSRIDSFLEEC